MENTLSAADLAAITNARDNDGLLGGNSWGALIILLLFFSFMGGGWNGRNFDSDVAKKSDLYESANAQNTFSEFRSMQNEMTRGFGNINEHLCNGFAGANQNIANNFANTNMGIAKGFYDESLAMNCGINSVNQNICNSTSGIQAAIADNGFKMQNCCCELKGLIHEENEKTRALITANTIQDLRDQVAAKDRELLTSSLVTSNVLQTGNIEAYMRQLLLQYNNGMFNNNGWNTGCGC